MCWASPRCFAGAVDMEQVVVVTWLDQLKIEPLQLWWHLHNTSWLRGDLLLLLHIMLVCHLQMDDIHQIGFYQVEPNPGCTELHWIGQECSALVQTCRLLPWGTWDIGLSGSGVGWWGVDACSGDGGAGAGAGQASHAQSVTFPTSPTLNTLINKIVLLYLVIQYESDENFFLKHLFRLYMTNGIIA